MTASPEQQGQGHTPLPWRHVKGDHNLDDLGGDGWGTIRGADNFHVCEVWQSRFPKYLNAEANARFIVEACNAYPTLAAENERLRLQNAALAKHQEKFPGLCADINAARKEVRELREALRSILDDMDDTVLLPQIRHAARALLSRSGQ